MYELNPECLLIGLAAQEVFMPTVGILQRLLSVREHAATVARRHDTLRTWEGIAQVLSRKMESERKYIERLEGGHGYYRRGTDLAFERGGGPFMGASTPESTPSWFCSVPMSASYSVPEPPLGTATLV